MAAFFTSRGSRACLMYKYINAYYIQEIDWVDYKGGQKGGRGLLFFFVYFLEFLKFFLRAQSTQFFMVFWE